MRAPTYTYFQVLEAVRPPGGREIWHAAMTGPGILCNSIRHNPTAETVRWAIGTDKVNCDSCLALLEDRPGPDWRAIP